jgi:hypothetical protein
MVRNETYIRKVDTLLTAYHHSSKAQKISTASSYFPSLMNLCPCLNLASEEIKYAMMSTLVTGTRSLLNTKVCLAQPRTTRKVREQENLLSFRFFKSEI